MVERIVAFLIPPSHREHVLGDLAERGLSPVRFVVEAVRVLPFIVASQVRRTSTPGGAALRMFVLLAGFDAGSASGFFAVQSLIPASAGVAALSLHGAYADMSIFRPWRRTISGVLAVTAAAFASQAFLTWLSPGLALAWGGTGHNRMLNCVLVFLVFSWHGEVPAQQLVPLLTGADRDRPVAELYAQVSTLENGAQRSVQYVVGVLILVASVFAVHAWLAPDAVMKVGRALASLGAVFAAGFIAHSDPRIARPATFGDFVEACRARIELQRQLLPKYGWIIFLPLLPMTLMESGNQASSIAHLGLRVRASGSSRCLSWAV